MIATKHRRCTAAKQGAVRFPIRTGPTVCPREISSTTTMRLEIALFSCPNRYGSKGRPDALVRTDSGELIPVEGRESAGAATRTLRWRFDSGDGLLHSGRGGVRTDSTIHAHPVCGRLADKPYTLRTGNAGFWRHAPSSGRLASRQTATGPTGCPGPKTNIRAVFVSVGTAAYRGYCSLRRAR